MTGSLVILHVLRRLVDDAGELRIAAPGLSPDERVVLWNGFAPPAVDDHPGLAPVVLIGDADGRPAYAEGVPPGLPLSLATPSDDLLPYVVHAILRAVSVLHRSRKPHGAISPDRVWLGIDGQVLLFGRGRRGGSTAIDLVSAVSLMPHSSDDTLPGKSAASAADQLEQRVRPDDRARLAAFVRSKLATDAQSATEQVVLTVGGTDLGSDEVQPDLGPDGDRDRDGLLDRWTATGGVSTSGGDQTPAMGAHGEHHARLLDELWTRLSNPADGPADRFDQVAGTASRALRALLADQPPDSLPMPVVVVLAPPVEPIDEDMPTVVGPGLPSPMLVDHADGEERTRPLPRPVIDRPPRGIRWTELVMAILLGAGLMWVLLKWVT